MTNCPKNAFTDAILHPPFREFRVVQLTRLTVEKLSTYVEPEGSFLTLLCILTKAALRCGNAKLDSGCDPSRDLKLRVQIQLQAVSS